MIKKKLKGYLVFKNYNHLLFVQYLIYFIFHFFFFLAHDSRVSQNISRSRFYFCKRNYFCWLILLSYTFFLSQDGSKILISRIVHWIRIILMLATYSKSQQHHLEKISFFSILQARSRLWFGFLMRGENSHRVCTQCTMLLPHINGHLDLRLIKSRIS